LSTTSIPRGAGLDREVRKGRLRERFTRRKAMTEEKQFVAAPLLSVGEAAQYLGVARKVLYRLIEEGRITTVKAGGAVRVEKHSLDEFKARGELT
jgi:excisionase family DNA binding protein